MRYFVIYLITGILSIALCFWISRRRKVPSIVEDMLIDPIVPFIILLFWPLACACLCDLLGIPQRRREKFAFLTNRLAQRREARRIKQEERAAHQAIVGKRGITVTPLCLSGKVNIAGKVWDAHSLNGYIASNENIIVKNKVDNELKVELIKKK